MNSALLGWKFVLDGLIAAQQSSQQQQQHSSSSGGGGGSCAQVLGSDC
jgi:hypothetical protein